MFDDEAFYEVLKTTGLTFLTHICWLQINIFVYVVFFIGQAELAKEALRSIVLTCDFLAIVLAGITMTVVILKEEYYSKVITIVLALAIVSFFFSFV